MGEQAAGFHGLEIYEGDLVHIWSNFYGKDLPVAEVFWNKTQTKFDVKAPTGVYHNWLVNGHHQGWFIEIIGSVHKKLEP